MIILVFMPASDYRSFSKRNKNVGYLQFSNVARYFEKDGGNQLQQPSKESGLFQSLSNNCPFFY